MNKFFIRDYSRKLLGLLFLCVFFNTRAQQLYLDDNATFYLGNGMGFSTSSNIVEKSNTSSFMIQGGVAWSEPSEYVNGVVSVLGAGNTVVNIGDLGQSSMNITTAQDDVILCDYTRSQPIGSLDSSMSGYVLSDTEYWNVTKSSGSSLDVMVSGLTTADDATYGGELGNELILVRYNGSNWVSYADSPGFGNLAYASKLEVKLAIKMYLQGALTNPNSGETSLMRDDLRVAGLLPIASPYIDGLTLDNAVLNASGNNAIVDWVWVELRDKSNRQNVIDSRSALLQRDGDVVDLDGQSPISFRRSSDEYYVVVSHRNHIGVITNDAIALSSNSTTLDFTNDSTFVLGGNNGIVNVAAGVFALFSGDFDGSGQVQNSDSSAIEPLLGQASSYSYADLDMNAQVQNSDLGASLLPNLGKGQQFIMSSSSENVQLNLFAKRRDN